MKSDNMPPRGWSASGGKSDSMPPRGWSASGGKSDFPEGVLRPDHAGYPVRVAQALKHLPELYFRGNAELLSCQTMLAVVGSRRPSFQAEKNLDRILRPLAGAPLTIVSGLAIGLDACGHEAALEGGLPTIAVVGSPVAAHELYPASNRKLADRILSAGGLLISPFPKGTPFAKWNFPRRNEIIAALSHAVLIAAAKKLSGALGTARFALDFGRDVLVIPGDIADPLYAGSNTLLQAGAHPVLSGEDILSFLGLELPVRHQTLRTGNALGDAMLQLLAERNRTIDELARTLKSNIYSIQSCLTMLEMKGIARLGEDGVIRLT